MMMMMSHLSMVAGSHLETTPYVTIYIIRCADRSTSNDDEEEEQVQWLHISRSEDNKLSATYRDIRNQLGLANRPLKQRPL